MRIRRYRVGEEGAVWRVVFEASHDGFAGDDHPDLIERWAPRDKSMAEWAARLGETKPFVAIIDEEIAGMAELLADGFIDYFYVRPDHQRRGVGTNLMERIEKEASAEWATALSANVSIGARPFFESQGFRVVEEKSTTIQGTPRKELRHAQAPRRVDVTDRLSRQP